jgi:hypothetical protein
MDMIYILTSEILRALAETKVSGIGITHRYSKNILEPFLAFPAIHSPSGIQIKQNVLLVRQLNNDIDWIGDNVCNLVYFDGVKLKTILETGDLPFLRFVQGDISYGKERYYKTFFAFPSTYENEYNSSIRLNPFRYSTGMPCQLDLNSGNYIKCNDSRHVTPLNHLFTKS